MPSPPVVNAAALLTVRAQGAVTLNKALLTALPQLKARGPVDLVPPVRRGGTWHLDTRPTAARRLEVRPSGPGRFRIAVPLREHLLVSGGTFAPGVFGQAAGTSGVRPFLRFSLGEEVQEEVCVRYLGRQVCQVRGTGYYALVPVRNGSAPR